MCVYFRAEQPLVYGVVMVAGMAAGWVGTVVIWLVWLCRQSTAAGYDGVKGVVEVLGICVVAAGAVTLLCYLIYLAVVARDLYLFNRGRLRIRRDLQEVTEALERKLRSRYSENGTEDAEVEAEERE
ncbi:hypothetical protein K505DRAFT_159135 [Melanomma pulvis-pyrius CBS 109.77]|uniref:Uncharacterized protein n=1 Tax=Melanomma pulvis-pyrius CBS 109.77 TaxID=1314802 RepID=A0A6A6XVH9_9PLEO|nr:hypothetical protein K505DRAFT_159135 [Melanomma pulvis-pyrius CBS 109.77]